LYRPWAAALPPHVELCIAQLPGREARMAEPAFTSARALARALADALGPGDGVPRAFFGHSMGALIAFELARELRRRALPGPGHLFVSGCRAPHLPARSLPLHGLPDAAFAAHVHHLAGIPPEALRNPAFMALLVPMLRADFTLAETYAHTPELPLECPITAFGGAEDAGVAPGELQAWAAHTRSGFGMRFFPGRHFFVQSAGPPLLQAIEHALAPLLRGAARPA
ncbi:MAG TPA: thioesterase domain-containing protein, partial [Longimicrobium sp.]|nr:thioesterase domain-containing protein [Longimicrobium sp.]